LKEILIVSGKGGAGKTTIASSLALFLEENDVLVDADVDASDLPILLGTKTLEESIFLAGVIPVINYDKCSNCGLCESYCKFNAIIKDNKNNKYFIDEINCEGCALCSYICPENAVTLIKRETGKKFISQTNLNVKMCHGELNIGAENSGKLVASVKQDGRVLAKKQKASIIIIDGPPGIGCPVIAAMSGVDLAVIVIEPTLSGIHDAKRIIKLAKQFNINTSAVINKYGLNKENEVVLFEHLLKEDIKVLGCLNYSEDIIKAQIEMVLLPEYNHYFYNTVKNIYSNMVNNL
jgi:MinD superfamily P-loop ATPase